MSDFHSQFISAMGGQEERLEAFLTDPTHMVRARVYQNNSVTATADAIVKNFPTLEPIVGTEFLRATAIEFSNQHPPSSPVLTLYGAEFPVFLESFTPAASLPYLSAVAHLDRAWTEAMFAENAKPLAPQDLASLPDDRVSGLCPGLHPSTRLVESEWPALEIWQANRNDEAQGTVSIEQGWFGVFVWWSANGVATRQLEVGEAIFLKAIGLGASFGTAIEKGSSHAAPETLFNFFAEALAAGVFANPTITSMGKPS